RPEEIAPFVSVLSRLHHPPDPSDAPQITSYWAANGLNQRKNSGARPLIGPTPLDPVRNPVLLFTPDIVFQNRTPNIVPSVRKRTVKKVTTVAPWVRCMIAEMNRPIEPRPSAVTISTAYARRTSSGATPPNTNTIAVRGIEAAISRKTYASALKSLPTTIARDEIGAAVSMSRVCFARPRRIAPQVNAGGG